jgi:hypothetical protein
MNDLLISFRLIPIKENDENEQGGSWFVVSSLTISSSLSPPGCPPTH